MRTVLLLLTLLLASGSPLAAHGGQYRGPTGVIPPGNQGGGPTGGGSTGAGPSLPGPGGGAGGVQAGPSAGPSTGGGTGIGAVGTAGRVRRGGSFLEPDLARWQYWWEFSKDPYLRIREAVQQADPGADLEAQLLGITRTAGARQRPSREAIAKSVLPAFAKVLEGSGDRDLVSGSLIAVAKIGFDAPGLPILPLLCARLTSRDQEIRETAALAMGISQRLEALPWLAALARDTEEGRRLIDRSSVDDRTRTFAVYGLGVLAGASIAPEVKARVVDTLVPLLAEAGQSGMNLRVGVLHGLRLVDAQPARSAIERRLHEQILHALWGYLEKDLGPGEQLIQAHVPPALAQILGPGHDPERVRAKRVFAELLDKGNEQRRNLVLQQSAAIALGGLLTAHKDDAEYVQVLIRAARESRDQQTRSFAWMALGSVASDAARAELLRGLREGSKALDKPWAALALARATTRNRGGIDPEISQALLTAFREARNPETRAALAVAIGLAQADAAAPELRAALREARQQDELAGYLSIGLALLGERDARDELRGLLEGSLRRPELFLQVATALGKLGDAGTTERLIELLAAPEQTVARLGAIAGALSQIGDARTLEPLVRMVQDEKLPALSRAFAAVALGGVCDKDLLPWNAPIARDVNYRAAVETLTNGAAGVLDLF
ncbi:MAG: hypothetical protein IT458_19640 [Planctomycetes bacterium]|nr:hypothetical protein [Planctomycetota bacterium]